MRMTGAELLEYCLAKPGAVPDDEFLELVDTSYETIVAKLPKSRRPARR